MLKSCFLVPYIFNISIVVSVSIDYFIQKSGEDEQRITKNNLNETRRQEKSYEDEWFMVRSITKRIYPQEITEKENLSTTKDIPSTERITTTKNNRDILDIFNDRYELSEESDIPDTGRIMILHEPVLDEPARVMITKSTMHDFFNLEPIVPNFNGTVTENDTGHAIRVWFVPEKYPCWELPVLYGEQNIETTGQIFYTHSTPLKNVVLQLEEPPDKRMPPPRKLVFQNKWCQVQPCFADHTLCLFDSENIATICDKGYVVKIPSTKQQMGLIHTINSMRNRVAFRQAKTYAHLPTAANMQQVDYDLDLQKISAAWLRQCLPGPAPCSALNSAHVTQLECTKFGKLCCFNADVEHIQNCSPEKACFVPPVIGCLHTWYESAGQALTATDIECGHIESTTFNTVQMLWAETIHIGCAIGEKLNGDTRVVCNFSPGAPFVLNTRFYCGILPSPEVKGYDPSKYDFGNLASLRKLGLNLVERNIHFNETRTNSKDPDDDFKLKNVFTWGVDSLVNIYTPGWARVSDKLKGNGTLGFIARLVTRYEFVEQDDSRCSSGMSIYIPGPTASTCVERGWRYRGLCYKFRDSTPGYRLVAVVAPVALFSLILYDLFSGVLRQTNY